MALKIGRKGRLYVVKEAGTNGFGGAAYGGIQDATNGSNTLSAGAAAMRHTDVKFNYDPFGRVNSTEKKTSPGQVVTFDRRTVASLDTLAGLIRPSGVLNTLPEADEIFEAAFGAKTNVTLSTTIAVGGAGTTTADTLTSAAGLAVGDAIMFVHQDGKRYVRIIQTLPGAGAVTWAPALPTALSDGQAAKGGITYKLTTDNAISLAFLHALLSFKREWRGVAIDKMSLMFDANSETSFTASGPGKKELSDAAAQADPGTFTVVGLQNPPSGIVSDILIADLAYLTKKITVELTNGIRARNEEFGADSDSGEAIETFRDNRRTVAVTVDAFAETAATLQAFAKAGTKKSLFIQAGRTEGNMIAVYLPIIDWKVPDTDAPDTATNWAFKGTALESADEANDEVKLAIF